MQLEGGSGCVGVSGTPARAHAVQQTCNEEVDAQGRQGQAPRSCEPLVNLRGMNMKTVYQACLSWGLILKICGKRTVNINVTNTSDGRH